MKKFVAVLNKKVEVGRVMNALAHMTVGLCSRVENQEELGAIDYADKDGGSHFASKWPYIVLRAKNSNQIRTLRNALVEKNLPFASFTEAMTVGSWEEQVERSAGIAEEDLEYFGVCTLVEEGEIDDLTRKYSLWT